MSSSSKSQIIKRYAPPLHSLPGSYHRMRTLYSPLITLQALLFKSNQKADLRKMEALNMRLLDLMTAASATDVDALPDEQKESSTIDSSKPKKLT